MKKRILFVAIALALLLVVLAACGNNYQATLDTIDSLLKKDYSVVEINVVTKVSGEELNGKYVFTFKDDGSVLVEYEYEEFNGLSFDGDNSSEYKKTVSGTAVVKDDVVVEGQLDLNTVQFESKLNFKEAYLKNVTVTANKLDADVSNARAFVGNLNFTGRKMHVKVFFNKSNVSKLFIDYTSANGAEISLEYSFTA